MGCLWNLELKEKEMELKSIEIMFLFKKFEIREQLGELAWFILWYNFQIKGIFPKTLYLVAHYISHSETSL